MDDPPRDPRLDAYRQRENSFFGRLVNMAIDTGRRRAGKPSMWLDALREEQRPTAAPALSDATPNIRAARAQKFPAWEQAPIGPPDFATMIADSLQASGIDPMDTRALGVIDNAAVYLHAADPFNRAASATPKSISAEWNQLGITEEQANEMLNKAIGYIQEQRQPPGRVADRLAADMTQQEFEPDWAALSERQVREAFEHRDTTNDYAEAYADVAGDATLSWRLEDENPLDILADVKRQARERVFGPSEAEPKSDVDRFISVLTHRLKQEGYTVREVVPERDNELDLGR